MNASKLNRRARGLTLTLAAASLMAAAIPATTSAATVASTRGMCNDEYAAFLKAPSVSTARAVGECEIDRRLDDLATVRQRVEAAKHLTSGDRSAMESRIDATTSGLKSLRGEIESDSTLASLHDDLHAIVYDYRVYVLVIRQDWLTYAADSELAAVHALETFDGKLDGWIATAKAAGYDTSAVEADQATLEARTSAVKSPVSPLPATLVALTPAGYNAGTAGPTMDAAAKTLATGWSDLVDARAAAEKALQDIKALGGS